jgi:hypothetical protein
MEKEAQSGAQEEVLSVELPAPSAWKKLVSLSLSLSLEIEILVLCCCSFELS